MRELAQAIAKATEKEAGEYVCLTPIDGLVLLRSQHQRPPAHNLNKPALCVVAQGTKVTSFGNRSLEYRAGQALVVSVEMPSVGRVVEASTDKPFLGVVVEFDPALVRSVMEEGGIAPSESGVTDDPACAMFVADVEGPVEDCILRLVRLLDKPQAIAALAPMIKREIYYWLLSGPHGHKIAGLVLGSDHNNHLIAALRRLRESFDQPIRVDDLAALAGMSSSAFHRHFKKLTSVSPLQYQKQLRLMEARRLMVSQAATVEKAAFSVGYQSPSQFSREYARMFGTPPKRDTANPASLLETM